MRKKSKMPHPDNSAQCVILTKIKARYLAKTEVLLLPKTTPAASSINLLGRVTFLCRNLEDLFPADFLLYNTF